MKKTKKLVAKKEEQKTLVIPPINKKLAKVTIKGLSPLLVNRFDEKSKQEIEEIYRGVARGKKIPKTVEQEYKDSLYMMPGKKKAYGIPASGIKNCAISACRFIDGISMTEATGAFHVFEQAGGLCEIKGKPEMDRRTVRVGTFGNKKPATRTRGIFNTWECTFTVQYRPDIITAEQLLNLYENAGFSIGLCEYRPEKKGNLGMFEVKRK